MRHEKARDGPRHEKARDTILNVIISV